MKQLISTESNTRLLPAISTRGLLLAMLLMISACATTSSLSTAIDAYHAQAGEIELGQSKAKVLDILTTTQAHLAARFAKPFEQYMEDEKLTEIYFFRSRSFPDGLVTDDEFTPYVFEDGVLVAIGWDGDWWAKNAGAAARARHAFLSSR